MLEGAPRFANGGAAQPFMAAVPRCRPHMTVTPIVSVITPTKNRLRLLRETIDSVQQQNFAGWEHVIVDDGSDDGTADEVQRRARTDPRIQFVQRTVGVAGAGACRNLGISNSRGPLVVFLDSDDLLERTCLLQRIEVMNRNADLDFAVFQTGVFVATPGDLGRQLDPELLGDDLLRFLYLECPWQTTAPIWRRSALERLGGFDESLPSWQDVDLHVRAIAQGLRYMRFPQIDHHFRWQDDPSKISTQQRRSPMHLNAATELLKKFECLVREGPGMNWIRQRAICSLYFFVAQNWAAIGRLGPALHAWGQIRQRRLGPPQLYLTGWIVLLMLSLGVPSRNWSERIANKWKGLMRLRTNAELV